MNLQIMCQMLMANQVNCYIIYFVTDVERANFTLAYGQFYNQNRHFVQTATPSCNDRLKMQFLSFETGT